MAQGTVMDGLDGIFERVSKITVEAVIGLNTTRLGYAL